MRLQNRILIVISFVSIIVITTLAFTQYLFDFIIEFSAGLLGIFFGFVLGMYLNLWKDSRDLKDLLCDLFSELTRIKSDLIGKGLLLYPDAWDSAVSSGQLRLLESEHLAKLSSIYRFVKVTEYEAIRCRDAGEDYRRESHPTAKDELLKRWEDYSARLHYREKKLARACMRETSHYIM